MPWARLDDNFHDHPKVDGLSLSAVGLFTLCLTWAHRHRKKAIVPGHIADARVRKLAGRAADKLAGELVAAGLWETSSDVDGYLIHDFADYLPKERDPEERAEAGRKGAQSRWQGHSKPDGKLPSNSMARPKQPMARIDARARPVPEPTTNSTSEVGSPNAPAGFAPRIIRAYVDAATGNGVPAPTEAQAKVERSARSLLAQGYTADDIEHAARNAAVGGWTDLSTQLQRDAARASPTPNGSTTDARARAALDLAERLDQPERKALG